MSPIALLLFNIFIIAVKSHICIWQPLQRGNFSIDIPGSHVCYLKEGPCGRGENQINGPTRTSIQAGSTYKIAFQQNLNHFYTGNPGSLDITFAIGAQPKEEDFNITLHTINDYNSMNEITQTNFTFDVVMPNIQCDECVIRLRYLSNNPLENDRGTIFYQCADIKLTPSTKSTKSHAVKPQIIKTADHAKHGHDNVLRGVGVPGDCCAPEQFATNFIHEIPAINYKANGIIWYDAKNQFQRMDVMIGKGEGTSIYDGQFSMISNFSSGIEYYYNQNNESCSLYGLDYWNSWCFGAEYNQSEILTNLNTKCINDMNNAKECKQWINQEFIFQSYNGATDKEQCLPSSISRQDGEYWFYHGFKPGPFDISIFTPNPVCTTRATEYIGCNPKRIPTQQ